MASPVGRLQRLLRPLRQNRACARDHRNDLGALFRWLWRRCRRRLGTSSNRTTRLGAVRSVASANPEPQTEQCVMAVTQLDKGNSFRALHQGTRAFIIANVWDAGSARVLAGLGFAALATSSAASAWAYGMRDGRITRDQALAHARAIIDATDLPVSVDLESGFGATANDVAETYRQAAAVGVVGATIEDLTPTRRKDKPLFDIGEATERVAAAVAATRELGFPFMLTARAEGFRYGNTDLDDAI